MTEALDRAHEFSRLVAVQLATEGRRLRITQRAIAEAAGVGAVQFSYYVKGVRGVMTVGTLLRAAERLGLDPQLIVGRAYEDLVRTMGAPPATATRPVGTVAQPSRQGHGSSPADARRDAGTTSRSSG